MPETLDVGESVDPSVSWNQVGSLVPGHLAVGVVRNHAMSEKKSKVFPFADEPADLVSP